MRNKFQLDKNKKNDYFAVLYLAVLCSSLKAAIPLIWAKP
jgi:hypothetical protein